MPSGRIDRILWIVRHGVAYEHDPTRWPDDADRPLTAEGKRSFAAAARGLKRIASKPDLVLTSPCVRAVQTAEILAEYAGWPAARHATELVPDADPAAALKLLRGPA